MVLARALMFRLPRFWVKGSVSRHGAEPLHPKVGAWGDVGSYAVVKSIINGLRSKTSPSSSASVVVRV